MDLSSGIAPLLLLWLLSAVASAWAAAPVVTSSASPHIILGQSFNYM